MRAPEFWYRDSWPGALLAPLGWAWGAVVRRRLAAARPWKAPVPVVCVGNLVAGGAGKTPVVLDLAGRLAARGLAVHLLSRGYGGTAEAGPLRVDPGRHGAAQVGDEPLLLARRAPTWVGADRAAAARAAVADGAQVLVMDDGFQNPGLAKDLSILVVDGRRGFGNGRVMPAGPLREPLAGGLARAGALVVMGEDEWGEDERGAAARAGALPVLGARPVPGPEAADLRGRRVAAFAGIGDPGKFFRTLDALGAERAVSRAFADHHPYTVADLARLAREAEAAGAVLVTTEKDAVRLPTTEPGLVTVLTITLQWDDEGAMDALLQPLLAHV
ncbi:MAG: tetraacyldisaccharide 4'-kinase [Hyphomicrobiales bacterium]|nr:tetraacyldisaccharide 4'-kinase [Hyphomicrobiales bacterium]